MSDRTSGRGLGGDENVGDLHSLSGPYALNALPELERRQFERHLKDCDTCASDVNDFLMTTARLSDTLPSEPAPGHLRESVLAQARQTQQERPQQVSERTDSPRGSAAIRWLSVAAASLLVAAAGLGVVAYNTAQDVDQLTADAASVAAVLNADDAESVKGAIVGGGTGSLVVSRERGEAVVIATDLSSPPAGSVYQLWAINDAGARSRGLLESGSNDAAGQVIDWPSDASTFGMTVEPAGGSEQPTSDPILVLDVPV